MSLTLPTLRRRGPSGWSETGAAALAVADVTSIHVTPQTLRAVIAETTRRHGGQHGVRAELDRRLADDPRHTQRTLDWARRTLGAAQRGGPA